MHPRVTFVVPCYNYGRFVGQAVESLLGQTLEAIEVIVIDDASTDDTQQILRRYTGDERIRVVRHEENLGHIRTYNEGIALARGEFVGLLSADDYCLRRDAVALQVAMFDAHPRVGFVYSAYMFADEDGTPVWAKRTYDLDGVQNGLREFSTLVFYAGGIPASGTLVRRICHDQLGDYDPRLPHAGDWDLWLRFATRYDIGYLAEPLFAYRIHKANMHKVTISPSQATTEYMLTVEKAFAALPADAPTTLRRLRPAAIRWALLHSSRVECSSGRMGRAWVALTDAVRRSPSLIVRREFAQTIGKLLIHVGLGHSGYNRLADWYREHIKQRRGAAIPLASAD